MKYLSKYEIAFKGLKEGKHQFTFEIDDRFFEQFDNSEVKRGKAVANVILTKQSTLMILDLTVNGEVELLCDRCLESYLQPTSNSSKLYIKFGAVAEDSGEDIIVITHDEYEINAAQYLYELIILGLPIKHAHPFDAKGNSTCDPEMENKLNEYLVEESTESENEETDDDEPIDERWSELKKLLDK